MGSAAARQLIPQRWFRENLKLGEEGLDNDIAPATYERTGASVMGKGMLGGGELAWPEEAPFRTPVFVVTHTKRDPRERPGGTTWRRPAVSGQDRDADSSSARRTRTLARCSR